MPSVHEMLSEQFCRWEKHGRGWQVFDRPTTPEPPFIPFRYSIPQPALDDGRRPTLFSSLIQGLSRAVSTKAQTPPAVAEECEAEPQLLERQPPVELQIWLPRDFDVSRNAFASLLKSTFPSDEPLSFEFLGLPDRTVLQLALAQSDSLRVRKQIKAIFPDLSIIETEDGLARAWNEHEDAETAIIEFGLLREFLLPLALTKEDPFVGIAAALNELQQGELALFQVLFQPVSSPWGESISRALNDGNGKPVFVNAPQVMKGGEAKAQQTLFAVVLRIATRAPDFDRALGIAREMAMALRVFANPAGNELFPLNNDGYQFGVHEEDVLLRQTHRSGMILTLEELLGFVHLPSIQVPKLARQLTKTKAAPQHLKTGILLGKNIHGGRTVDVRLSPEQRVRHAQIIGASGTGKTTLLFNLIQQDIHNGQGLALLDPHGDLVDRILGVIPKERIADVVLLDPADEEFSVAFNILSAHSDLEKHLLASDLVSVFKRLSSSWGDQMGSVLQNAILAFLESGRGGTLVDLRRFLIVPAFRAELLTSVHDSEVLYYWQKAFPQLAGNKSIGPVLTRLETFLAPKQIRYMVGQPVNRLDFGEIMDTGKIFLAKLSQGLLGNENSYLLGTLLVAKFQQLAMSRQAQRASARKDFWIYLDEFQNFITPSLAEILTGARKYRIGLVLAHHELRQLERDKEVASAVLSNCYTRMVFRVGDEDARKLADGFASFDARDLQNLAIGQAICRVERSDFDFNLSVPLPTEPSQSQTSERREEVITASRKKYGTPRAEVEALFRKHTEEGARKPEPEPTSAPPPRPEPPPKQKPASATPEPHTEESKTDTPKSYELPKASEFPKSPAPEKEPVPPTRPAPEPRDLGRGGAQHKAIQQRIKEAAEKLGFRSGIESELADKRGSVDLLLERGDQTFACEISISTTVDHEVGNISKCLKAGFPSVAVICLDDERLKRIAVAVSGSLGAEAAANVRYFLPDAFIAYLQALPSVARKDPNFPETRRGYKVKRSEPKLTPKERKQREDAAICSIANAMRNKH